MEKFFYKAIPFLPVKDITETICYYKNLLGFNDEWYWGNPPTDAGCHRDKLSLLFNRNAVLAEKIEGLEVMMVVDDVDGIFTEFSSKSGIEIISPLKDEPWGIREFTLRDINGYFLRFSCSIERINRIRMEHHKPSTN
jgi:uncharacterized glyoxalase superfamily protein PhnB